MEDDQDLSGAPGDADTMPDAPPPPPKTAMSKAPAMRSAPKMASAPKMKQPRMPSARAKRISGVRMPRRP